jgi:hypothetical protein
VCVISISKSQPIHKLSTVSPWRIDEVLDFKVPLQIEQQQQLELNTRRQKGGLSCVGVTSLVKDPGSPSSKTLIQTPCVVRLGCRP